MKTRDPLIDAWVRPQIRALSAYHVPEPAETIKLDAMENPYTWEPAMIEAWLEALRAIPLNRYPDAGARQTKAVLRQVMAIPEDMALSLGNGSDELIQMLMLAVGGPGRVVLAPEPGFVMYPMLARVTGLEYVGVPLRADDFSLDLPAMLAAIEQHRPALIFLAYPNNPTGNLFARDEIEQILDAAPGLVILDEAYTAFTDSSFMAELGRWPNLLVMRTVSKIGLAGLRLGLLAGPSEWLEEIEKTRLPYNINVLTQASAVFALQRYPVLAEQTRRIREDREQLYAALSALPGVRAWPSQANFLLLRVARARAVFEALKARGILIKCLDGSHPLLRDCLRITVGLAQENQTFFDTFRELL
jgi:histidinol-phosphate aminotransferase